MKKKAESINVELLLKVKEAILAHAEHFDMGEWKNLWNYSYKKAQRFGECGTSACLAGFCVFTLHPRKFLAMSDREIAVLAEKRLGVDENKVFYYGDWPKRFRKSYSDAEDSRDHQGMAQAAADFIDHIIANPDDFVLKD